MLTRTQWELACFAGLISLAGVASTTAYNYGVASSQSNVSSLENTIESYEKASKLDTEAFLIKATEAANALKLSIDEREELERQRKKISSLLETIQSKQVDLDKLQGDLSDSIELRSVQRKDYENKINNMRSSHKAEIMSKDQQMEQLLNKLASLTTNKVEFTLSQGEAKSLNGGSIQVGFIDYHNYSNRCNVSINNQLDIMSAGEYKDLNECKVVLTSCTYKSRDDLPAKFELLCP
ncbi:hypothetical protein HC752_24285 [Vibrio sp. S9_S30]|uniref:hypothetical protein n=1 Tax=Vibrio sp. S9_S30 TaxID=2720226 RepID=UPI00168111FC|nr:hypothetical protein [Vibrio sp. S9_S30]MBD1560035.1 hypothetical protein [Vibrio sp. S9_S30]